MDEPQREAGVTTSPHRAMCGRCAAADGEPAGRFSRSAIAWILLLLLVLTTGCQSGGGWVRVRRIPYDPLNDALALSSWRGPRPTPRVAQWLRRYDLADQFKGPPVEFVSAVQEVVESQPSAEDRYALAELAYIAGKRLEADGDPESALDMYGLSVAESYRFLMGESAYGISNPYDPHFRLASDLYNGALESALRIAQRSGPIRPGAKLRMETATRVFEVSVVARGNWPGARIERMEFTRDYDIEGLRNHYRTFGLGVPLMGVCQHAREGDSPAMYYAPGMVVPMTAFLRVLPRQQAPLRPVAGHKETHACVLELFDPLQTTQIDIDDRFVPLETDLSTPLAYLLSNHTFQQVDISTRGLLSPKDTQSLQGLYMLEPYDPNKTPVLMVHGLWSSLVTWMEMFNDLRGNEAIRDRYQFWFYLYPTGQPFWITASQLRQELAQAAGQLDPEGRTGTFQNLVLVGHSMGGLICRMQTLDSGDAFWNLVSDQPIDEAPIDDERREALRQMLYFEASPAIGRVVTIASPHRGSRFSNNATRWLGGKLIELPDMFNQLLDPMALAGDPLLRQSQLLRIRTSIDSLSPASPVLPLMLAAPKAPWTHFHNVVGVLPKQTIVGRVVEEGDGVVAYSSAHLQDVESEIVVPADHVNVHRHPRTVLEVQRILLEHLQDIEQSPVLRLPPVSGRDLAPVRR